MLLRRQDILNMRDYQRKIIEAYLSGEMFLSLLQPKLGKVWLLSWLHTLLIINFYLARIAMSSFARWYHNLKCACAVLSRFIPPFSSAMAFLYDSKLSLTSRSFWTRVSFLSAQSWNNIFINKPSLKISFPSINSRLTSSVLFPAYMRSLLHLKSFFELT